MLNEWTDRMPANDAGTVWRTAVEREIGRKVACIEDAVSRDIAGQDAAPMGFYDAMRHFLTLRDKLFPGFPTDPAWRILVTLAETPEDRGLNSVTGITHGAGVPMATVVRYLAMMELDGIIERVPHPTDGRQVIIRLTDEGRRRLETIAEKWATKALLTVMAPVAAILMLAAKVYL